MILITGPGGFVGRRLMQALPDAVAAPSLREADPETICRVVEDSGADTIIHTAAISDTGYCQNHPEESYRANVALPLLLARATICRVVEDSGADTIIHTAAISDTGYCQNHPEESYRANVALPLLLARAAQGRKLICFSSDQVYNGSQEPGPYTEDMACPASVYAAHKLEMEQRVLDVLPTAVMLRAQWMYDLPAPRPNYLWNLIQAAGPVAAHGGDAACPVDVRPSGTTAQLPVESDSGSRAGDSQRPAVPGPDLAGRHRSPDAPGADPPWRGV